MLLIFFQTGFLDNECSLLTMHELDTTIYAGGDVDKNSDKLWHLSK